MTLPEKNMKCSTKEAALQKEPHNPLWTLTEMDNLIFTHQN